MDEKQIVRQLAIQFREAAHELKNEEKRRLHKASNDLNMIRPVVLIDELPWKQMDIGDELTLRCGDPFLRELEWFFRSKLYQYKYFPADMYLSPFLPIPKIIRSSGIGLSVQEEILKGDTDIVSHTYNDVLSSREDVANLHLPKITYDERRTIHNYNVAGEVLGDVLPVKITGASHFFVVIWDDICQYRGLESVMLDLIERPDLSHEMAKKFTEIKRSELEQYELLGLFDSEPDLLHCTPVLTDSLPQTENGTVTRKNIWGRGAAQIFSSVSKEMRMEFDIPYMIQTVGQCGLVYYGCCEPLDKMIDIVEKIPNLRKISITPWADIQTAAECIGKKYVVASKPNPAVVAVSNLDEDALRSEIGVILDACKSFGCAVDLVLKDISTCCNRPENIFRWEKIVMDMVENY